MVISVQVERVEAELAKRIRPLVNRDLSITFYDPTTVRIHGEGHVEYDIRAHALICLLALVLSRAMAPSHAKLRALAGVLH